MKNNFSHAQITNLNITEKGDISQYNNFATQNISDEDLNKLFKILNTNDESVTRLVEVLNKLAEDNNTNKEANQEVLNEVKKIYTSNKSTWRDNIQNFLGNAANVSAIVSLGFQVKDFFDKII